MKTRYEVEELPKHVLPVGTRIKCVETFHYAYTVGEVQIVTGSDEGHTIFQDWLYNGHDAVWEVMTIPTRKLEDYL